MKGYLERIFEGSEEENRRAILRAVSERGRFDSMLDVGCYDGEVTMRVAHAAGARRVAGVELLEEHAKVARARGVDVTIGDLERPLPYGDGEFELVHANQVIEHLRNTDLFLRETRRVCSPDGIVVISTNNLASWHNVVTLSVGLQPMPVHVSDEVHVGNPLNPRSAVAHEDRGQTHLRLFVGRALVELAEHHGLELVELTTSGYYPLPPRLARMMTRVDPMHGAFLIGVFRPAPAQATRSGDGEITRANGRPTPRAGVSARVRGLAARRRDSGRSARRSGAR